MLFIEEIDEDVNLLSKSKAKSYLLELRQYDETQELVNKPEDDSCVVTFNRATVRIVSEESSQTLLVEVLPEGGDMWIPCFRSNSTAITEKTYSYITTAGLKPHLKPHYIHSIKFYDNEPEEVSDSE